MADIKFSAFTAEANPASVDFIVGYAGANNVRISPSDLNSGGVTSVALTMPAAFSVAGSPVTGAGTFAVTGSGAVTDYVDGTGALQVFPTSLITGTVTTGEIPYASGANVLSSSNQLTFTTNTSTSGGPTIGIGLAGVANSKGAIEIDTHIDYNGSPFDYFLYTGAGGPFQNFVGAGVFAITMHTSGRYMGSGIHIYSDERTKKDISVSSSKEDLETLSKIEISNYKYIDEGQGPREHKKVIAQQVMKHYPTAVSINKDVVPCIYKKSTIQDGKINVEIDCCKVGDKVKLIYPDGNKELVEIVESDGKTVKVNSDSSGEVFVYGKEVEDYHSVDYDALAMLNISATQELHKIIKELQIEINKLKQ